MIASESNLTFEKMLNVFSPEISQLLPENGISEMIKFYSSERVNECDLENFGDTLLFQWGIYDFTGKKEFQVNITRQFILGEDEPLQLLLTFYYEVNDDNSQIKAGNFWCKSPNSIPVFSDEIEKNLAYQITKGKKAERVELLYEQC